MTDQSDRQHDAFANPAKALCRDGNLRVLREAAYRPRARLVTMSAGKEGRIMSTTITGVVTNGVVVPNSPLPEGANVEVTLVASAKPGPRGVPADQVRGI